MNVDRYTVGLAAGAARAAMDERHDVGAWAAATGMCDDPAKPDGAPCSKGTRQGGARTAGGAGGAGGARVGPEAPRGHGVVIGCARGTMKAPPVNVLGGPLADCSKRPVTGFFRDGCCNTSDDDAGSHTVCVVTTAEFLTFSRGRGNDLSTPRPEFGFPGLKAGDRWCLCAARWQEALAAGCAPLVVLTATHERALEICSIADLKRHAIDMN